MANLQQTTKAWVQAQKLLSRRLAQRRGQGPHPPDRPAGGVLPPGHQHPPVLLQPGRPDPPVLPPQPAPLAQLDGHQQGLQRLQAGGLPLRDRGSGGGRHRRLPGLGPGRGQHTAACVRFARKEMARQSNARPEQNAELPGPNHHHAGSTIADDIPYNKRVPIPSSQPERTP